jgi:hypothetical protein
MKVETRPFNPWGRVQTLHLVAVSTTWLQLNPHSGVNVGQVPEIGTWVRFAPWS